MFAQLWRRGYLQQGHCQMRMFLWQTVSGLLGCSCECSGKTALYGALRRLALLDEKKPTQRGTTDIARLRTAVNSFERYELLPLAFDAV